MLASVVALLSGLMPQLAVGAGFIPVRVDHAMLPAGLPLVLPWWLTPLSATLLHAGAAHLVLNLVILVFCGLSVERTLGSTQTALLYAIGAYAAAAGQWALSPHSMAPMIGASGAISAFVAVYALFNGQRRASAVGPFSAGVVHVAWLALGWIGIQLLIGVAGLGMPIAIGAHIGGFIAGLILARPLLLWHYRHA